MNQDWMSCDGTGNGQRGAQKKAPREENSLTNPTRRNILIGAAMGALGWIAGRPSLAQLTITPSGKDQDGNILVIVFLRGGMDGLNFLVPYQEDAYYSARPSLAVGKPKTSNGAIDLDGFFGFHPNLAPLVPLFQNGSLALIHACGSNDTTRSHFEAMATMEQGVGEGGATNGWIARHLNSSPARSKTPLRAVSITETLPDSLRGARRALNLQSLSEFRLMSPGADVATSQQWESELREMYGGGDPVRDAGKETLEVLRTLQKLGGEKLQPGATGKYPETEFGQALRQVAQLIRAGVGLEVACVDRGGWDTHVGQNQTGAYTDGLNDVAQGLSAFTNEMGQRMERINLVVMTEFGRRVHENNGLGTDHGRGGVMMVLGGGVKGGKVYGDWPGLKEDQLDEVGDLRVVNDYRSVLSEMLLRRGHEPDIQAVFPGLSTNSFSLFA